MNTEKYIKMTAAVLSSALLLSSCGTVADEKGTDGAVPENGGVNTQAAVYSDLCNENNILEADEDLIGSANEKGETKNKNSETVLPPNMTMDDLLNLVQINGKTLTMPTTLNNIMALDEGFSYNLYSDLEECKKQNLGLRYNILYNDVFITDVYMFLDDYNPNDMENSRIVTFTNEFNPQRCDEAGISFKFGDIDFNST